METFRRASAGGVRFRVGPRRPVTPVVMVVVIGLSGLGIFVTTGASGNAAAGAAGHPSAASSALVSADLALSISDSPDPVPSFGELTYTAIVRNLGPDAASGTRLRLRTDVQLLSVQTSQGACTANAGSQEPVDITCELGVLAGGAEASVMVRVRVTPTPGGTFSPVAMSGSLSSATLDPVEANNSASQSTVRREARTDLAVDVTAAPEPVTATHTSVSGNTTRPSRPRLAGGQTHTRRPRALFLDDLARHPRASITRVSVTPDKTESLHRALSRVTKTPLGAAAMGFGHSAGAAGVASRSVT